MDISTILLAGIVFLGAAAVCVIVFERLGFGAILGFIFAGILIGPHTPGPVPVHAVEELQSVAELGVVLFLFIVGLEMRPAKVWAMRRLLFGLGTAQVLATAAAIAAYVAVFADAPWETATILGLAMSLSSTAIVMTTLGERGDLNTEHGQTSFAVLMAQDLWIVPIMALVPILAHTTSQAETDSIWEKIAVVTAVLAGIVVVGRYLLPGALGYCANRRQMDAFGVVLLLAVIAAAWAVEHAGISMTLGAFLLGMLLSGSDLRYQIVASVASFKSTLMGLFFIAVGMSIDVGAVVREWAALLVHVPVVLSLKGLVLVGLILAFDIGRATAVRVGFYLSQVGEFAFVLLGAASVAGLLSAQGHTLAMLVVALSMVATPAMVKIGDRLAIRFGTVPDGDRVEPSADLARHVVVVGYEEVGQLLGMMLEKANIPHLAFDRDISVVRHARRTGRDVHFGDMNAPATQEAAGLGRAAAVYVTSRDVDRAKALSVSLHRLYPGIDVHVRVRTLEDQEELAAAGIRHAGTGYIESTLARGSVLLKDLGMPEDDVNRLVGQFQHDDYALIRAAYARVPKP